MSATRTETSESLALDQRLALLETAGLIRLAQIEPELEYLFRHILIQETAYHSLLGRHRAAYHLLIGDALERLYPDRREELAATLGHHFAEGGESARALHYLTLAGDQAATRYANSEAAGHYARAIDIAREAGADGERLRHLYAGRERALEVGGRFEEALDNALAMEKAGADTGDKALALAGLLARAMLRAVPTPVYDLSEGETLLKQALAMAREVGDRAAESKILWNMMLLYLFENPRPEVIEYGEHSLAIARELGLREQAAFTLNDMGRAYRQMGRLEEARRALDESRPMWRELNHLPMLTDNLAGSASLYILLGRYDEAAAFAAEGYTISAQTGNVWGQAFNLYAGYYVHFERGNPGQAAADLEESVRLGEQMGLGLAESGVRADLGWLMTSLGDKERGAALTAAALERAQDAALPPTFVAWTQADAARVALAMGDDQQAERLLRECQQNASPDSLATVTPLVAGLCEMEIALFRRDYELVVSLADEHIAHLSRWGVIATLPDALIMKAESLAAKGRTEEASAVLSEARRTAESLGALRSLLPILSLQAKLAARRGDQAEAEALRGQAREIALSIADHTGDAGQKAKFLALPQVIEVM